VNKTEDKKKIAGEWYGSGFTAQEIAGRLHTTRATIYRWLKEEGVNVNRRKRAQPKTELRALAEQFGVSMPTARKYMRVIKDAELTGFISLPSLVKLGVSNTKQKIVVAFLEKAGYIYDPEDMTLWNSKSFEDRQLTVPEVVRLFTETEGVIDESAD
jgi:transposase